MKEFEHHAMVRFEEGAEGELNRSRGRAVIDGVEYQWIKDRNTVRGRSGFEFERWGRSWLHPEAEEIEQEIRVRLGR
jgi:hypothetical protein